MLRLLLLLLLLLLLAGVVRGRAPANKHVGWGDARGGSREPHGEIAEARIAPSVEQLWPLPTHTTTRLLLLL